MFYEDRVNSLIRRHFAADFMAAMRDADPMDLHSPHRSVNVPLLAECTVYHDKKIGQFIVDARVYGDVKEDWIGGKQVFSTRNLANAQDRAALVDYIFEGAKKEMLNFLAETEVKRFLAGIKP